MSTTAERTSNSDMLRTPLAILFRHIRELLDVDLKSYLKEGKYWSTRVTQPPPTQNRFQTAIIQELETGLLDYKLIAKMSTDPRTTLQSNGINFTSSTHADIYPFISPAKLNLTSLNVLITGASRGIGRATALAYAAAGASGIILAARSDLSSLEAELYTAASSAGRPKPTVVSLKLDVRSKDSVSAAAKTVEQQFGHLDIVINNAGSSEKWVPMLESDPEDWWSGWETNLFGSYLICRYFLPLVLKSPENGPRTTIAVSSVGAHGKRPTASGYQTNKLALLRLMEFVDSEYGTKEKGGLLTYSIHPGGVVTDLSKDLPIASLLTDTPELAGETMVWLSAEKREWLAGRYVSVNWDMQQLLDKKDEIIEKELLKVRMAVS